MRLASETGAALKLAVEGYQFSVVPSDDPCGWDANWLRVTGSVVLPDGRTHRFCEPCLTTWEAAELRGEGDRIEVRVHLSLEAAPPFGMAGDGGMVGHGLPLLTDRAALGRAAAECAAGLRAFPTRRVGSTPC